MIVQDDADPNAIRVIDQQGSDGSDLVTNVETLRFTDGDVAVSGLTLGSVVTGDSTSEALSGTAFDDVIAGGGGDDTVTAGAGNDIVETGEGADEVDLGDGADSAELGGGNDSAVGGADADSISGGAGEDTLLGNEGNDTLLGGDNADSLDGGLGNDSLRGDLGDDTLIGGEGADTLSDSQGLNIAEGGAGNDQFFVAGDVDGGADDDTIGYFLNNTLTDVTILGGDGNDQIYLASSSGGSGNTRLIDGGEGNDTIGGANRAGNQTLIGGEGDDSISSNTFSGFGSTLLQGDAGNDTLAGSAGAETLDGGTGDDLITGGAGDDTILGGGESEDGPGDVAVYSGTRAQYTVVGDQSGLQVIHNAGSDGTDVLTDVEVLRFSDGDLLVATGFTGVNLVGTTSDDNGLEGNSEALVGTILNDTIEGLAGDDSIVGLDGEDTLIGDEGADTIEGGGQNDSIQGGDGDDSIEGGTGNDTLEGGTGLDVAIYAGNSGDFLITGDETSSIVTDQNAADGDEGTDSLTGIRILRFADQGIVFNEVPVTDAEAYSIDEDVLFEVPVAELLAGDTDPDGDPLTLIAVQNATNGTVLLVGDTVRFTPNPDYFGPASFEYVVSDGYDTATQTVSLDMLSINDAPVAIDDAGETEFETAITLNVLTNDSDVESDPLQVTATGPASNGTVTIGTGGEVTYTPSIGFSGTDTFSYTVSDGVDTDIGQVTITVLAPPNTPPVAVDDAAATLENQSVAGSVLANDTDVDANPLTVYAVEGLTAVVGSSYELASGALVTVEPDGSFVYNPNGAFDLVAGATATDSFTYTVSDGEGGFDGAVVTIDLTGVGEPPIGTEDTYATDEDSPVSGNVITDDTGSGLDSDPDGDPITVTTVEGRPITDGPITLVSGATVTMAPDGTFTYDPSGAQNDLSAGATGNRHIHLHDLRWSRRHRQERGHHHSDRTE